MTPAEGGGFLDRRKSRVVLATDFLQCVLRLQAPWAVADAYVDSERRRIDVRVEWCGSSACPMCGEISVRHDWREEVWRDGNVHDNALFIHALVPRVNCVQHGIRTVLVSHGIYAQKESVALDRLWNGMIAFFVKRSSAFGRFRELYTDEVAAFDRKLRNKLVLTCMLVGPLLGSAITAWMERGHSLWSHLSQGSLIVLVTTLATLLVAAHLHQFGAAARAYRSLAGEGRLCEKAVERAEQLLDEAREKNCEPA